MRLVDLFATSTSTIVLPDGSRTTSARIASDARHVATHLLAAGAVKGDRIAVRLVNGLTYLEILVACSAARLVLVSVNTRYSEAEVSDLVVRSGAKRLIDERFVRPEVNGLDDSPAIRELTAESDDPFLVFTTSGTTSRPKMVRHTQRSIASHGFEAARAFGYTSDDVALIAMPLFGTFGMSSLTAALAGNASIVMIDQFDALKVSELIVHHRISVLNGSDDMFHRLVEQNADLSTVSLGGYARFNTSLDDIVERSGRLGARLTGLYGMSEVQALFSLRDPEADSAQRALAGGTMVSPEAACRVVNGELQLQGPSLFEGYLCEGGDHIDAELTGRFYEDGWFRTGDAAELDAVRDSTFTYHSRIGDVLRLGGFLVAPADIEATLLLIPSVSEAQVVAVDLPNGTRPVAFVIASDEFEEASSISHCRGLLARYKVPIRIVKVDEFPMTPSANGNKIQRVKLREMAEAILVPGTSTSVGTS
jgi:fatty-acyl-CoA synthase